MNLKHLPLIAALFGLLFGPQAVAQDTPTCDDIEWSSVVTDEYPTIADACNAVMEKDGELYARVTVELLRVRGDVLTFRVLNRDGSSGGSYTQNVGRDWRANIGGNQYRARDLSRGQRLNVYLPGDRWAIIHEGEDGPAVEAEVVPVEPAPELPTTASQWPLLGTIGAGLLMLGGFLTLMRRRTATAAS